MIIMDYVITYPHAGRPLAILNREALREGIDHIRYIYRPGQRWVLHTEKNPDAL
jgi:hypothetical protein